jgi:hypothetical protein
MKRFLKWAAIVGGAAVGTTVMVRAIQRGRAQAKDTLGRAESVAEHTRAAAEHTEAALAQARGAI